MKIEITIDLTLIFQMNSQNAVLLSYQYCLLVALEKIGRAHQKVQCALVLFFEGFFEDLLMILFL